MNIVTNSLVRQLDDPDLAGWIEVWDELEALMVGVYKAGVSDGRQKAGLKRARRWLRRTYPHWKAAFRPFWQGLKVAGRPVDEDPFLAVLAVPNADAVVGDWRTMQLLPAAREAMNLYVLARVDSLRSGDAPDTPSAADQP